MSDGDAILQVSSKTNYDSDSSSSSISLFNRPSVPIATSSQTKAQYRSTSLDKCLIDNTSTGDQPSSESNSHVRNLEYKLDNLQQIVFDLSDQLRRFNQHPNENYLSGPSAATPSSSSSFNQLNTSLGVDQFHRVQDILNKTTAALERRDAENHLLRQELDQLRSTQSLLHSNSSATSTPFIQTLQSSPHHLHSSTFVPLPSDAHSTISSGPANIPNTTLPMPFTMSFSNSLPIFSGKDGDMPTKFITEFEVRASGLFGCHDEYFLRAVKQVLSDTALTWFVQRQQECPITGWSEFKRAFLERFRTPDKVESLRACLRLLWQGDNESTSDYFERLIH